MASAQNTRKIHFYERPASRVLADHALKNLILENNRLDYNSWLHYLGAEELIDQQEYPSDQQVPPLEQDP